MTTEVKDTIDAEAQKMYLQALLDRGYKFRLRTWLFGKPYVWITDTTGKWFLERIPLEDADA